MDVTIGQKVPNFAVSEWVQGAPTNFDQEVDHITLLEVFQVNCPGCFLYAIPEAINIYKKYKDDGVRVLGLATAFEDFDKNTVENLRMLAQTGEVIGETKRALTMQGRLGKNNTLPYKIPFPLGMDKLTKAAGEPKYDDIIQFINQQIPDFDTQSKEYKSHIIQKVKNHMAAKEYTAETFEKFALRGTPSMILVDRKGILRDVSFGDPGNTSNMINALLAED